MYVRLDGKNAFDEVIMKVELNRMILLLVSPSFQSGRLSQPKFHAPQTLGLALSQTSDLHLYAPAAILYQQYDIANLLLRWGLSMALA